MEQVKQSQIFIKKVREQQRDQFLSQQQTNFRKQFYTHLINNKLQAVGATEQEKEYILSLFIQQQYNYYKKIQIDESQLNGFYGQQIYQLQQTYNSMQDQFSKKQKECWPILQIVELKLATLKIIQIQYELKEDFITSRYQISAFTLFKVVSDNHQLIQVTIKGVEVLEFQLFMKKMNFQQNKMLTTLSKEQLKCVSKLNPLKEIKLSINAKIEYLISQKQSILGTLKDLAFFKQRFSWISDITFLIIVQNIKNTKSLELALQNIWKQIQCIKKFHMKIQNPRTNWTQIKAQQFLIVKSGLFGGFASFTEIVQLSFKNISFSQQIEINDFLAIEQIFSTIIENNSITHLNLYNCNNFPVIPKIPLQLLHLSLAQFRRYDHNLINVVSSDKSLISINSVARDSPWMIDQQLINQLKSLSILGNGQIYFDKISPQSVSNIQFFYILQYKDGRNRCLSLVFPKLTNLRVLHLLNINVSDEELCSITSPYLEELRLSNNNIITDKGIEQADLKWVGLKCMALYHCFKLTENIWQICKFRNLQELWVYPQILAIKSEVMHCLRRRGVKVIY